MQLFVTLLLFSIFVVLGVRRGVKGEWRRGGEEGCEGGCGGWVWRRGVEDGCGGWVWRRDGPWSSDVRRGVKGVWRRDVKEGVEGCEGGCGGGM